MVIDSDVHSAVLKRLRRLEAAHDVRIVYACESGSRAWGFASADSDYDVRFIYLHPRDWYLRLLPGRDVIEEPITDAFDMNGWDLKKALGLLYKSNPPLLEWLGSPIVYLESTDIAAWMRAALAQYYAPASCFAHYLHMAQGNWREYLQGETVRTKKYFYVLRPLLAMQWISRGLGLVPTDFHVLVHQLVNDPVLLGDIQALLQRKQAGDELQSGPRIASISHFIETELQRLAALQPDRPVRTPIDALDRLFLQALHICRDGG